MGRSQFEIAIASAALSSTRFASSIKANPARNSHLSNPVLPKNPGSEVPRYSRQGQACFSEDNLLNNTVKYDEIALMLNLK